MPGVGHRGLIHAQVLLHGAEGPWATRAGFDEIGACVSGIFALGGTLEEPKQPLMLPIVDNIVGWLGTVGVLEALLPWPSGASTYTPPVSSSDHLRAHTRWRGWAMINPAGRSGRDGPSTGTRMIMLIRHAEKPLQPCGSPHGVSPDGQHDPHSLTVTGWIRAGALGELFAPSRGDPPADLRRPDTIYASAHAGGHSKRSMQTVGPLASRLGLEVIKRYAAGEEAHLAGEIGSRPGATLIAWHHETLHKIAHHLGEVKPTPPRHWPPDRFDLIWTFTLNEHGWCFAQIPQLLLPGDLPYPIADCFTAAKT